MILSLIVGVSKNNVIGRDNDLPWSLPDDLRNFRAVTEGKPVIMGRKTHESIGRVLPKRRNIVITRQDTEFNGCDTVHSLEEALGLVRDEEEVFVIGGGQIYREALAQADRVYLTRVDCDIEGDVTFPELGDDWRRVRSEEHSVDEDHAFAFTFEVYERAQRF